MSQTLIDNLQSGGLLALSIVSVLQSMRITRLEQGRAANAELIHKMSKVMLDQATARVDEMTRSILRKWPEEEP